MDMTTLLIFVMLVILLGGGNWVYSRWHVWKIAARPRRMQVPERHGRFPR